MQKHDLKTCIEIRAREIPEKETKLSWAVDANVVDLRGNRQITFLPKSKCMKGQEPGIFFVPKWIAMREGLA